METIDNINTWEGFLTLLLVLILGYWFLKGFTYAHERFTRKNAANRKVTKNLRRVLLVFKTLAVVILLLNLIAINPINHTSF
jgi:Ca2+/Na+ antiporter